jgi:hypothetical protein
MPRKLGIFRIVIIIKAMKIFHGNPTIPTISTSQPHGKYSGVTY